MGARARFLIAGLAVSFAAAMAMAGDNGRTRTLSFYHIHTKETLTVTYKRDGRFVPEAMKKIDWLMRDWRKNEAIAMDPQTIDVIWEMYTELGSREPIHVISGYRSNGTNEMLRKTRGGQASQSQHISGKAIDISFPDIPARQLRYSAMIRERGGVGYYPTSAIPFVHVDTSRVRHWPNMPKRELALLFPSGRTQHRPAEGGSITPADVRAAKAAGGETANQVAAFYSLRAAPKALVQVADASGRMVSPLVAPAPVPAVRPVKNLAPDQRMALAAPMPSPSELQWASTPRPLPRTVTNESAAKIVPAALPKLVAPPRLAERPSRFVPAPSESDRKALAALVAEASNGPSSEKPAATVLASFHGAAMGGTPGTRSAALERETSWIPAPEFDDDHPEELVYRPFPLAPLLTATPSADDAALSVMHAPEVGKTLMMLDEDMSSPPMRLRPGQQLAELLWAKEFRGQAVSLADLVPAPEAPAAGPVTDRLVKTSLR